MEYFKRYYKDFFFFTLKTAYKYECLFLLNNWIEAIPFNLCKNCIVDITNVSLIFIINKIILNSYKTDCAKILL